MSHTTRRRALSAAVAALLALAPSALAAHKTPQPAAANYSSEVAAQPRALTGTHAQTPSDINPAVDPDFGTYTPGAIPAVSYPSGGAYTPGSIPAVSYPRPVTAARAARAPDNSSGVSAKTIVVGIAGSLLALSGLVGIARRSRRVERGRGRGRGAGHGLTAKSGMPATRPASRRYRHARQ
jgi:hypothetical protein